MNSRARLRSLSAVATSVALVAAILASLASSQQVATPSSLQELARALPPALREKAEKALTATEPNPRIGWLRQLDEEVAATSFLIAAIRAEMNADVRRGTIQYSAYRQVLRASREYRRLLEDLVATDPDGSVVSAAHKELRHMLAWDVRTLVERRVRAARDAGVIPDWLHREEQLAIDRSYDLALPRFMRTPPPVFEVAPRARAIRVLAFGDYGVGDEAQRRVASAMHGFHVTRPFTLGITTGDNFYGFPRPEDPASPRWERDFEALYGRMGIPIYASLGNHDFDVPDQVAAEWVHSRQSKTWKLPALSYTFTAGPAQFFAIDGNDLATGQLAWLAAEVKKSTAPWKIVYGHYPLRVALPEKSAWYDDHLQEYRDKLLPIFRGQVDLYVTGHHHSLQHLKPLDGVHLLISGAAGREGYPTDPKSPLAFFADSQNGFAVLEIDETRIDVTFVNAGGQTLHRATVAERPVSKGR